MAFQTFSDSNIIYTNDETDTIFLIIMIIIFQDIIGRVEQTTTHIFPQCSCNHKCLWPAEMCSWTLCDSGVTFLRASRPFSYCIDYSRSERVGPFTRIYRADRTENSNTNHWPLHMDSGLSRNWIEAACFSRKYHGRHLENGKTLKPTWRTTHKHCGSPMGIKGRPTALIISTSLHLIKLYIMLTSPKCVL